MVLLGVQATLVFRGYQPDGTFVEVRHAFTANNSTLSNCLGMEVPRRIKHQHVDDRAIKCGSAPLHATFTEDKYNLNVTSP